MDTVEWIELGTLFIVIAAVIPIYRYLGAYTRILVTMQQHHNKQSERLESNAEALNDLDTRIDGVDSVLSHLMDQVDRNASELKTLREGVTTVASSFTAIASLVAETDQRTPEPPKD